MDKYNIKSLEKHKFSSKSLRKNKKGAVELSINLIIMLVIGLTVLGLIIAFVTGFLGDAQKGISGQVGADDQNKLNQVLQESGNFAISPATLTIKKNDKNPAKLYGKLRNPTSNEFTLNTAGDNLVGLSSEFSLEITSGKGASSTSTFPEIYAPPIVLSGGQEEAYAFEVYAESDVDIGTYYATFTVTFDDDTKYTKVVILNVE